MTKRLPSLPSLKEVENVKDDIVTNVMSEDEVTENKILNEDIVANDVIIVSADALLPEVAKTLNEGDIINRGGVLHQLVRGKLRRLGRGSRVIQRINAADSIDEDGYLHFTDTENSIEDVSDIEKELDKFFD